MTRIKIFTVLSFLFLLLGLVTPAEIYSQCDNGGNIVRYTSCEQANYNCEEQVEVLNIRADQVEEYKEHCENTYTSACTEIIQLPGISGFFLYCYNRKYQPNPTSPPPECGYLGQPCCLDMEGKYYCLSGQGGPKVTGGTGCMCTVEEPTVAATPFPTPITRDSEPDITCDSGNGVQTGLGCIPTDPTSLIKWALPYFLGLGGLIAFSLIIFSGIRTLTSAGNPEVVQGAKETITSTVAGLLFIILSLFLLRLIGVDILKLPGLE